MMRVLPVKPQLSIEKEDQKFKRALLEAIDESLDRILGKTGIKAIYFHLEQNHHLKREDIPDNLKVFLFHLERIFGNGALVIQQAIMENLYSRLSLNVKDLRLEYMNKKRFNFIDYITDLRIIWVKRAINTHSVEPYNPFELSETPSMLARHTHPYTFKPTNKT